MQSRRTRTKVVYGVALGCLAILASVQLASTSAMGQTTANHPRIYVIDGGILGGPAAPACGKIPVIASYLVVHRGGLLLWEAGALPDRFVGTTLSREHLFAPRIRDAVVQKSLKARLLDIGYAPKDITYLALSHNHLDHSANANDYAASTWLVRKADRDVMFPVTGTASGFADPSTYDRLKDSRTILLEGDHDVFGDGTVVIKPAPGHTPGHQILFVRLANTGPVLITGDHYHCIEERKKELARAPYEDVVQYRRTTEMIEAFVKETRATVWVQHDPDFYSTLKKSPAYYD